MRPPAKEEQRYVVFAVLIAVAAASHLTAFDWHGYGSPRYAYSVKEAPFAAAFLAWIIPILCMASVAYLYLEWRDQPAKPDKEL